MSACLLVLSAGPAYGVAGNPISILSPRDNAVISSSFVAVSGVAPAGSFLQVLVDEQAVATTCAGEAGRFDVVLRAGRGHHEIRVQMNGGAGAATAALRITMNPQGSAARSNVSWELLQPGDVILSHSTTSGQGALFEAVYTHVAIYVGPGADGAAWIAEAVDPESSQGLGEVRAVPIEHSLAWSEGRVAGIFRAKPRLSDKDRDAIVEFARGTVNRGLKFWSASGDFGALYSAWLLWDQGSDRPINPARFEQTLSKLGEQKFATDRFNCATFVWRAFWEGSNHRIDLADPNRALFGGPLGRAFSPAFLTRVAPYFLTADSFYRSGKLEMVP